MLPAADHLARGLEFFARRHGRRPNVDVSEIAAAIAHAADLAQGDMRVEPAALFFACALRSRAFGSIAQLAIPFVARAQAHDVGLDLQARDLELDILRARVLYRAIDFAEMRAWFESRLSVLPSAT